MKSLLDRIFVKFLNLPIRRKIANAVADYLQIKVTEVDQQINQFFINRPFDILKGKTGIVQEELTKTTKEVEKIPGQTTKKITEEQKEIPSTATSQPTGSAQTKQVTLEETKTSI